MRALLLFLVLVAACGESRPRHPRRDASVALPPSHGLEIERLPPSLPKTRIIGLVVDGATTMLAQDALRDVPSGASFDTGNSGLVIDVGISGRVTVSAHSKLELGELSDAALILREGTLHVSQPVTGNSSRPELRIATPRGTVVLTSGGEALVVVTPSGRAYVGLWSGAAEVRDGAIAEDGGIVRPPLLVGGGSMILSAGAAPRTVPVSSGLELEGALRAEGTRFATSDRGTRVCASETTAAETMLRSLEGQRTTLDTLRTRHTELVAAHSQDAPQVSREIVAATQSVLRHRDSALVALERAHACAAEKAASPILPLLERARVALAPAGGRP